MEVKARGILIFSSNSRIKSVGTKPIFLSKRDILGAGFKTIIDTCFKESIGVFKKIFGSRSVTFGQFLLSQSS
jgi:hypothetical protein